MLRNIMLYLNKLEKEMNNQEPFPRFKLEKTEYRKLRMYNPNTDRYWKYLLIIYIIGLVIFHLLGDK